MISVVQKAFDGPEGALPSGTLVDSSGWRNEGRLHACRYLRAATEVEIAHARGGGAHTAAAPVRPVPATGRVSGGRRTRKVH